MSFLYSGSLWSSLYCGVSSLCVGLYRWLVKVSWLGKLVSVFWWVELYFFSLLMKSWVAFLCAWCPLPAFRSCFVEFTRCLSALLMNLWGRKCSPRPTPPPSWLLPRFFFYLVGWILYVAQGEVPDGNGMPVHQGSVSKSETQVKKPSFHKGERLSSKCKSCKKLYIALIKLIRRCFYFGSYYTFWA